MTMLGVGIAFIIFVLIRSQARPAPKTMNAQYQEMTNEYLKVYDAIVSMCLARFFRLPEALIFLYWFRPLFEFTC